MSNLRLAYELGRSLAYHKYASEIDSADSLAIQMQKLLAGDPEQAVLTGEKEDRGNVLSSASKEDKASRATWGDKIDLEPESARGIEV